MNGNFLARGAIAAALVAVLVIVATGGDDSHEVVVVAPSAQGLIKGMDVRAAGRPVGTVAAVDVTKDRRARVRLRINEDRVWPLPVDTKLQLRLGGTIKFTDRYIDLQRGRAVGADLPEGGTLRAENFEAPTEFDQLVGTFDEATRKDLETLLANGGLAVGKAKGALRRALKASPPALDEANQLLDDLGYDTRPLYQLVESGDRVVDAIDRSEPGVGELIQNASVTFDAAAQEGRALAETLEQAPETLADLGSTLRRANGSLVTTNRVVRELAPGVREARKLVRPLTGALTRLEAVGPDATATLTTLQKAAPDLTKLLDRLTPLAPTIEAASKAADLQVGCLRPYTPEIIGLLSTWGPRVWGFGDGKDKYLRAQVGSYTMTNAARQSTADVVRQSPGLRVAFPQPPGFVANQPWFQPQCGTTEDAFDPSKDPESGATELYPPEFYKRNYPAQERGR